MRIACAEGGFRLIAENEREQEQLRGLTETKYLSDNSLKVWSRQKTGGTSLWFGKEDSQFYRANYRNPENMKNIIVGKIDYDSSM